MAQCVEWPSRRKQRSVTRAPSYPGEKGPSGFRVSNGRWSVTRRFRKSTGSRVVGGVSGVGKLGSQGGQVNGVWQ